MVGPHVALVSRDAQLAEEIRRLCALAGQSLQLTGAVDEVGRVCRSASVVVVDGAAIDLVGEGLRHHPADVVVITDDPTCVSTWQAAVRVGARRVLSLPPDNAAFLELVALATEPGGPSGPLIGVVGGRGGVGASTLSVALSWAVAESTPVTLLDLDPWGGGLDIALGLERVDGLRWPQLRGTSGVVAASALRERLPVAGLVATLSMSRADTAESDAHAMPDRATVTSVVEAARRGGGVAIADLPRWAGEVPDVVIAECTTVLLVVPADVRGVSAATSIARRLGGLGADARLLVRTEHRSRLHERDIVSALGLEPLATIRHEADVTAAADRGELLRWLPRSQLGRAARNAVGLLL